MVDNIAAIRGRLDLRTPDSRRRLRLLALVGLSVGVPAPVMLAAGGTAGADPIAGTAASASVSTVYRWGVVGNRGAIQQLQLDAPTAIAGIPTDAGRVTAIATSNSDGYALTNKGEVYAWGVGSYGELGDGRLPAYSTRAVRVRFPAGVRITALPNPMPFDGGLAIDSKREAFGWGLDGDGDLCAAGLVESLPERIPLSDVTLATGARTHSLFYSHGRAYACGSGDAGELGDGSATSHATPVRVIGLPAGERITALTSSWEGSGALLADGRYYDWGYNAAGQLGDGTTNDSPRPVEVDLPAPVTQVFQGGSGKTNGQTIAILDNGQIYDWGANGDGQLGNGTTTSSDTPIRLAISAGVAFTKVNSGGFATYAISSKGQLWDWGSNTEGQLGLGPTIRMETRPTNVGTRLTQISSTAQNVAGLGSSRGSDGQGR